MKPQALLRPARLLLAASASLLGCASAPTPPAPPPQPAASASSPATPVPTTTAALVHVQVLAVNDFHGNLQPPSGTNGVVLAQPTDPIAALPGAKLVDDGGIALVPAGGAAFLAAHIAALRAENPNTVVVSAGDLTGASPLVSNLLKDEPTVAVMNALGLDYEAVGNHDFDRGIDELTRLARGGCSAGGAGDCDGGTTWGGAKFTYLAANVTATSSGKTVFPPYGIRDFGEGASKTRVAFIGETLKGTPQIASVRAMQGLAFADEAASANALVPELKAQGVSAIVLLIHQGALQEPVGTYDSCVGISGDLLPILDKLDPAIGVVVSGHTHQAYDCVIGGRIVTSAMSYGRLVTKIDLTIDPSKKEVVARTAKNLAVTRDVTPDPKVSEVVAAYAAKSALQTDRVVGWVKSDVTGNAKAARSASCETPLGDLIADAQRDATRADLALMNPGGIRADLVARHAGRPDHAVTFAEAFEVQPFANDLVTMTLTGAQLQSLFEAQFGSRSEPRILQVSNGFSYSYAFDRAGNKGKVWGLTLRGAPIDPKKGYRVAVNSFLANGGDSFQVLKQGVDVKPGGGDIDALTGWLAKNGSEKKPMAAPALTRIHGNGCN